MSNQQVVDLMEHVWESIGSLCSPLTEAQWKTATDCPGWSVQDQVSHLVGAESGILGNPRPDHTPQDTSYVKNDFGQSNEVEVDFRRSWPGQQVLDEFRELTGQRLSFLRGLTDEGFATIDGDRVTLTRDGLMCVDGLLPRFFEPQFRDVRYS